MSEIYEMYNVAQSPVEVTIGRKVPVKKTIQMSVIYVETSVSVSALGVGTWIDNDEKSKTFGERQWEGVDIGSVVLDNPQPMTLEQYEMFRKNALENIGTVPKRVLVLFLTASSTDVLRELKAKTKIRVTWPDDLTAVRFVKELVSIDRLQEAGISPRQLLEMEKQGIVAKRFTGEMPKEVSDSPAVKVKTK